MCEKIKATEGKHNRKKKKTKRKSEKKKKGNRNQSMKIKTTRGHPKDEPNNNDLVSSVLFKTKNLYKYEKRSLNQIKIDYKKYNT